MDTVSWVVGVVVGSMVAAVLGCMAGCRGDDHGSTSRCLAMGYTSSARAWDPKLSGWAFYCIRRGANGQDEVVRLLNEGERR